MHGPGANSEHPDGTAQRERQHGCIVEGGIMGGTLTGVAALTIKPFESLISPHASPQHQLAYAGVAFVLTMVTAVFLGLGYKIPEGLPKLFLLSLVLGIIGCPTFFGSLFVAAAVNQLAGWQVNVTGVFLIGLLLWTVVVFGIVFQIARVISRRTRVRG